MAECSQHAGARAVANCTGCAEPFCGNCLVTIRGKSYCAGCKSMAVSPDAGPKLMCHEANEALKYALVGIICFGIILEPVAISKALKARKMIAANPRLDGGGRATAALIIASIVLVLNIIGLAIRVSNVGQPGRF